MAALLALLSGPGSAVKSKTRYKQDEGVQVLISHLRMLVGGRC